MKFIWKNYDPDKMPFVEDWIDEQAASNTGIDNGFRSFHEYWITEGKLSPGKDYWCKVVYNDDGPFAVIAFSLCDNSVHIMVMIAKPDVRGKGCGTSLLSELISDSNSIFNHKIIKSTAIIFPNNSASRKAFENAGFVLENSSDDGDVLYLLQTIT